MKKMRNNSNTPVLGLLRKFFASKPFIWSFFLIAPAGAATVSVSTFLATAKKDEQYEVQRSKSAYLERTRGAFPLLDKAEFRVKNTGLEIDRNQYNLIITPAGVRETAAADRLLKAMRSFAKHSENVVLNELLKERYVLIVRLIFGNRELELHRRLKTLIEDRIAIASKTLVKGDFETTRMIEAQEALSARRIDIAELENEMNDVREKIRECIGTIDSVAFDTAGMICADSVMAYIRTSAFAPDTSNMLLENSRLKFEEARSRSEYETVAGHKLLSRVELCYDNGKLYDQLQRKYDGKVRYDLGKAYSITLGFDIPWIGPDRMAVYSRTLSSLTDSVGYEKLRIELDDRLKRLALDVRTLMDEYAILENKQAAFNAEAALKTYLGEEGADPVIILRARESLLKGEMATIKIRGKLFRKYIDILDNKGVLPQAPLRNYLSAKQEPLTP